MKIDYIAILGQYYGEKMLMDALHSLGINDSPRIPRDDTDKIIEATDAGMELTFTDERALEVSFRAYPDGAIVLSNLYFHGTNTDEHAAFDGELPLALAFGMKASDLNARFGFPNWVNDNATLFRWNTPHYCISARLDELGKVERFGFQMPNRFTHKISPAFPIDQASST